MDISIAACACNTNSDELCLLEAKSVPEAASPVADAETGVPREGRCFEYPTAA